MASVTFVCILLAKTSSMAGLDSGAGGILWLPGRIAGRVTRVCGVQSSWGWGQWKAWSIPEKLPVCTLSLPASGGEVCTMSPPWFRYLILICKYAQCNWVHSSLPSLSVSELALGAALGTVGNGEVMDSPVSGIRSAEHCLDLRHVTMTFRLLGAQVFGWLCAHNMLRHYVALD